MELWIPVTLLAALAQTVRFGLQRQLKTTRLSSTGATFSRYLFSAPLAVLAALIYGAMVGQGWPDTTVAFWAYLIFGGATQVVATVCVMALFARRNFSVGIAFVETTVLMAVPVGWVILGDTTSVIGFGAIVLGFVGVVLLSDSAVAGGGWRRVANLSAGLGLAAGLLFAMAGVGYRGAVLALDTGDSLYRALWVLAVATALQTAAMAIWMTLREPREAARVVRSWRIAGLVGLASMIGSTCWFVAFTMQNVAYVNAVGQVQVLMSLALTVFVFKERIVAREWQGGVILTGSILVLILYG